MILKKVRDKKIYIVGHTDNVPIRSFVYPSNWELSTARSSSVCRLLIDQYGIDPGRFTAMGKAFYQPLASNDTPEGRHENRRVEIIIADFPGLEGESGEVEMRSPTSSPHGGEPVTERELGSPENGAGEVSLPGLKSQEGGNASEAAPNEKSAEEKVSEEKILEEKVKTEEKFFKDALTTPEAPAAPEVSASPIPSVEDGAVMEKAPEKMAPEELTPPVPDAAPAVKSPEVGPDAPMMQDKPDVPAPLDKPGMPLAPSDSKNAPEAKPAPGESAPVAPAA
jgi:chemotaxis protein MotB